jgi:hypothetical protein
MTTDPILAEIRRTREAYAARFAGDIRAMIADLRQRQKQAGRKVVSRSPKLLKRTSTGPTAKP